MIFGDKLSQDPPNQFSQSFHRIKTFWVQMIDLNLFFRYLKGRCLGNRFCEKMANSPLSSLWHSETEFDIATLVCALTAQMMPVYRVKISWNSVQQLQSWQGSVVNVWYDTAKKWHISSNISGSTEPIFAIITPYESALRADDGCVAYFPICQGTLPWQPNNIAKTLSTPLISFAFGALVLYKIAIS